MNSHRQKFLAMFDPPYFCFFCGEEVTDVTGNGKWSLNTHHKDGDERNDKRSNLKPAHKCCHSRHHFAAHRERLKKVMIGNTNGKYGRAGKPKPDQMLPVVGQQRDIRRSR